MEFRFDASQDYQLKAIKAVCDLMEGLTPNGNSLSYDKGASFASVVNQFDLPDRQLLENLQKVQAEDGIERDTALELIEEKIDTITGPRTVRFPNFSIEMETGTGKTYVYLRTIHELFKRWALRKFIIVVPSIAVKEGVLKTLEVTQNHLMALYNNPPLRFVAYKSVDQISGFTLSSGLEIMVMTIDAFTRDANIIRKRQESLQDEIPLHYVQSTRPILILDEPQNMESEKRIAALASLNPAMALRYSATHRNPYNVIHRLTPYDAYREGLVKRIEVASVIEEDNQNLPFLRLDEIEISRKMPVAKLAMDKLMKSGAIKRTLLTIRHGDDLEEKTGRIDYHGFKVDEINFGSKFIHFANNVELSVGQMEGAEKAAIFEAQIRATIEEHLRKQRRFKDQGIKVISLFFIDRVDNYASDDGIIKKLFDEAFDDLKQAYPEWRDRRAEEVREAYFANRKKKDGSVEFFESTGKNKADEQAFNLIMREKERLLSFDEPVSFIFSHSALKEGWDNPNVFQICTMREVGSETERRQQVGRGVRLPVDQTGERIRDERVNVLTVIASESYERFVTELQSEIEREYGKEGVPPRPKDKRKRTTMNLRKAHMLKPEFKELWEKIRHKTFYAVNVDSDRLVREVLPELDAARIKKPRITLSKAEVWATQDGEGSDIFEALTLSGAKTAIDLAGRYPFANIIGVMENLMEYTSPPMRISRRTLREIYLKTTNREAALDNPNEFAHIAVGIIKHKLADQLIDGIRYEKTGEWYDMSQFAAEIETWTDYLVKSEDVEGVGGTHLYDGVPFDSDTIERPFIEALEKRRDVKLYIKLPSWFKVPTPIGDYNPDWAIVMENPEGEVDLLYLVRETKGTLDLEELRPDEKRKILCGRSHFNEALGVSYQVVTDAGQLPDGGV